MATRSTIALEFADGSVHQVYCQWDGYLGHNGEILQKHYIDPFKVKQLVALGAFPSLCELVEDTAKQAFTQHGEELEINKFNDIEAYFNFGQWEEYNYILRCIDGKAVWFVSCDETDNNFVELKKAF